MDEALAEQQREAYKVPGVDDEIDINPAKQRKAAEIENVSLLLWPICHLILTHVNAEQRQEAEA